MLQENRLTNPLRKVFLVPGWMVDLHAGSLRMKCCNEMVWENLGQFKTSPGSYTRIEW